MRWQSNRHITESLSFCFWLLFSVLLSRSQYKDIWIGNTIENHWKFWLNTEAAEARVLKISPFCMLLAASFLRWNFKGKVFLFLGSRDGAVVRALICHQCHPFWFRPGKYTGWVFCSVVLALLRGFFSGSPVFLPPEKNNISKFQFVLERGPTWKPASADVASSQNIAFFGNVIPQFFFFQKTLMTFMHCLWKTLI